MVPSEITSTKACKLGMFCVNSFSQQAMKDKRTKGRNKICISGKELSFVLSVYSFKVRKSARF